MNQWIAAVCLVAVAAVGAEDKPSHLLQALSAEFRTKSEDLKSEDEFKALAEEYAQRFLDLAEKHAKDPAAIDALGPLGSEVQPVFVTLDPARDRPELIGRYAERFHPRFLALWGTESQTREVATAYKVYFEKVPMPGTDQYAIDHTSFTYVLDAEGKFAGFFPPGTRGARIAERLRSMLAAR